MNILVETVEKAVTDQLLSTLLTEQWTADPDEVKDVVRNLLRMTRNWPREQRKTAVNLLLLGAATAHRTEETP